MSKTKFIFVSGGVISALGKGITSASISFLLKNRGFSVTPIKCENNLNWDFGTINPIEHGDPFLCADGLEGDQDLGNYERFLNQEVGFPNFMTMGQLYLEVIQNERNLKYNGEDVEPIPHITDAIINRIKKASENSDFAIIELGGTVGEYENNNGLYYEAARIMALSEQVVHIHVTYILKPPHIGEPKTKPAQLGIRDLMQMGISPNFIVMRGEDPIDEQRKYKFGLKFGIPKENIISAENLTDIHKVPLHLYNQNLDSRIIEHFGLDNPKSINLDNWLKFVGKIDSKKTNKIKIAIVGKYFGSGDSSLNDSYHALFHAIKFASVHTSTEVEFVLINSDKEESQIPTKLIDVDGVIIPIGWGSRGINGKLRAIQIARENKIPFLGLCYGMQLACVEYAQNVLKLEDAHSEEVNPNAKNKIIHSIPLNEKYQTIKGNGSSMRLGTFKCFLKKGTISEKIYSKYNEGSDLGDKYVIEERHRHRFEFNNEYKKQFEDAGFVFSGTSPDDMFVEMIELPEEKHPFFVATQAHPEYKSYPLKPHPLFLEFIMACINK